MADAENTAFLSRRKLFRGAALLAIPVAPVLLVDPVLAAIEAHQAAYWAFDDVCLMNCPVTAKREGREVTQADQRIWDNAADDETEAFSALIGTTPETPTGARAMLEHLTDHHARGHEIDIEAVFASLLKSPVLNTWTP